jgi:uncharacterized repeat protein (TIGR01451 family)
MRLFGQLRGGRIAKTFVLFSGLSLAFVVAGAGLASAGDTVHKSYVCKYVGQPNVDERLQTGQNPIWVDNHSLTGKDNSVVAVGDTFSDKQVKSVVIVANTPKLDPEPGIDQCPAPVGPPPKVTTSQDHKTNCDGVFSQTTTTTTPYILVDGKWVLDTKNAVTVVGDWVLVRALTQQEQIRLECVGTVTVTKALAPGSLDANGLTFPVTVSCAAAGYSHTFNLAVGDSDLTQQLPAGTSCTVSETPPAGWQTPTYTPSATVTVVHPTVAVTVVNNRTLVPTNPVLWATLALTKLNSPTTDVSPKDVITYTLTARADGNVTQQNVIVSDVVPTGTTYFNGSAACTGGLTCTPAYDAATRTLTWGLGAMNPGDQRTVTFKVTVNADISPSAVITNVGTAWSERTSTVSNEVTNKLAEVLGEVIAAPAAAAPAAVAPAALPATGSRLPVGGLIAAGLGLIGLGTVLTVLSRRQPRSA